MNQYTPYGSLTYAATGNKDAPWSQTVSLSPVGQQLLDAANKTSLDMAGLQGQGFNAVRNAFSNLPSQDNLPARQFNPGQTAQDAIMAREMPILDMQHDRLDNQLANQGIAIGSEAYKNAQDQFGRQVNDAVSRAALHGIDEGQQARQQAMQEQNYYSTMPLNMLNALRTGSQVTNPTFSSTPQGANYLGAAQAQYQSGLDATNAENAATGNFMSGLMNLGGAAMLAPQTSVFGKLIGSDVSIKQDIRRVGTHRSGVGLYEFRYLPEYRDTWGHGTYVGHLAHEVEFINPQAVRIHRDGYKMVDYGAL